MSDKSVKARPPAQLPTVLQSGGKKTAHNVVQFDERSVVPETKHVPAAGHDGSDVEEETVHADDYGFALKFDDPENSSSSRSPTPPLPNDLDSQLPPMTGLARITSDLDNPVLDQRKAEDSNHFTMDSPDSFQDKHLPRKSDSTLSIASSDGSLSPGTDDSDGRSIDQGPSGVTPKSNQGSAHLSKRVPAKTDSDTLMGQARLQPHNPLLDDLNPGKEAFGSRNASSVLLPPRTSDRFRNRNWKGKSPTEPLRRAEPEVPGISPKDIKIKTRNRSTPFKWMLAGALLGAGLFGTAGTFVIPGIGTSVGTLGGFLVGAAIGAVSGGVFVGWCGLRKMIRESQQGHIKAALQWLHEQSYEFTDQEKWNLQHAGISRKQWRSLLHVPNQGSWGVKNEEDRQLIRAALIMAVAKTEGNAGKRLKKALVLKDLLLERPKPAVRGYSVLRAPELHSFDPYRIRSTLEALRREDALKTLNKENQNRYDQRTSYYSALRDDGTLELADKVRPNDETLKEDRLESLIESDVLHTSTTEFKTIREALLLCLAKEGYAQAVVLKNNLYKWVSLIHRKPPIKLPGYVALSEPEAWAKLRKGQSDKIDFAIVTDETVDQAIPLLVRKLVKHEQDEKLRIRSGREIQTAVDLIDKGLKKSNVEPKTRFAALHEAATAVAELGVGGFGPRGNNDHGWKDAVWERAERHLRQKKTIASPELRKLITSKDLRDLVECWPVPSQERRRGTSSRPSYSRTLEGFLETGDARSKAMRQVVSKLKKQVKIDTLTEALRLISGGTEGRYTTRLRGKVTGLMKDGGDGPKQAARLLGHFVQSVEGLKGEYEGAELSEAAAKLALPLPPENDGASTSGLSEYNMTDATEESDYFP